MAKKKAATEQLKKKRAMSGVPGRPRKSSTAAAMPDGYSAVLSEMTRLISESRHRAAATVNRELVLLYWQIGAVIVRQQESAAWGDAVVETLACDLRLAFPDMRGFGRDNVFRMRQFARSVTETDAWAAANLTSQPVLQEPVTTQGPIVGTVSRQLEKGDIGRGPTKVGTVCRQSFGPSESGTPLSPGPVLTTDVAELLPAISWSHHRLIFARGDTPAERYFYMKMSIRERWSVRELRRQIDAALFLRYMSVRDEPEKCLPDAAETEAGPLLPFRDHYVLEFLGLEDEHSEKELRHSILANLRDFFLEFGRDLAFVGEEYPLTVGNDTFRIDLLFFHRRLRCLIAVELKIGDFKPEYVGKSQFYAAALDAQIRLDSESPSLGLVLCKSADRVQVRLALSAAAEKVGVATYQTALPDEALIRQRLEQLPALPEDFDQ